MEPSSSAAIARQTWELENNIPSAASDPDAVDAIYQYDEASQTKAQQEKPWANDPHHFRRTKISALALLKMVVHARAGGNIEVMGLMQGKCEGDAIIVMDAFALPVEGTETRVNAQADAYEYMVEYSTINKQVNAHPPSVSYPSPAYHCPALPFPALLQGLDLIRMQCCYKYNSVYHQPRTTT
jgi:COP9 signalosome complex subunit 5